MSLYRLPVAMSQEHYAPIDRAISRRFDGLPAALGPTRARQGIRHWGPKQETLQPAGKLPG